MDSNTKIIILVLILVFIKFFIPDIDHFADTVKKPVPVPFPFPFQAPVCTTTGCGCIKQYLGEQKTRPCNKSCSKEREIM